MAPASAFLPPLLGQVVRKDALVHPDPSSGRLPEPNTGNWGSMLTYISSTELSLVEGPSGVVSRADC